MRLKVILAILVSVHCFGEMQAQVVDTLYCDADATVSDFNSVPYEPGGGRQGFLSVGNWTDRAVGSGINKAYLRFDLNGIDPAAITSAKFQIFKARSRFADIDVRAVDDDLWEEYELYRDNAPMDGDVLASGRASRGWSEFDVTGFVAAQTDDMASFSLSMQSTTLNYLGFNSREGGNPPMLIVTHSGNGKMGDEPATPGFPSSSSLEHGIYLSDGGSYTEYGTIQEAVDAAGPGQEVVLGPGVYYQTFRLRNSGTADQPITLRGDGSPRPIIDGTLTEGHWENTDRGLITVDGDYWIIDNLEVRNAHPWGEADPNSGTIYIPYGDSCVIRNCLVRFGGNGIFAGEHSRKLLLEYNEVCYNSWPGAGYEHGHYVNNEDTLIVRFCHIHNNGGQNLKTRAEKALIEYNYIHSCGNYQVDLADGGFDDQDAEFIGNVIVTDNQYRTNGQFIVFGEDRHGGSLFLYNNTFIHLFPDGANALIHMYFPTATAVGNTTFNAFNNVFYVPAGGNKHLFYRSAKNHDKVCSSNWISSNIENIPGLVSESAIFGDDPLLEDVYDGMFRPASGESPLVDAADENVNVLPQYEYEYPLNGVARVTAGSGVDIGAYEYTLGGSNPSGDDYDFNDDGNLNIADVIRLIMAMIGGDDDPKYDLTGDGNLTIADAVKLIGIINSRI